MKKMFLILAIALAFTASSCSAFESNPMLKFNNGLENVSKAAQITQETHILNGGLEVYSRQKTYVKEDGAYTYTDVERNINAAGGDSAYDERTDSGSVGSADVFAPKSKLRLVYLEEGYYMGDDSIRARIKKEYVDDLFGIISRGMDNVILEMTVSEDNLTYCNITYEADDLTVNIAISFEY